LLAGFWLLSRYLDRPAPWRLAGAAAVMALVLLARYAGAAVVLTGIIGILVMAPRPWRHRVWATVAFTAVAVLPMAAWMVRNMMVANTVTGRELFFHPVGRSHVWQALYTVSGWLLIPPSASNGLRLAVWLGLAALAAVLIARVVRAARPIPSLVRLLALFIVTYAAFLAMSLSFLDANSQLDDRLLSPVLAAMLILGAYALDNVWPPLSRRPALAGAVMTVILLLAGAHGMRSAEVAASGHEQGW